MAEYIGRLNAYKITGAESPNDGTHRITLDDDRVMNIPDEMTARGNIGDYWVPFINQDGTESEDGADCVEAAEFEATYTLDVADPIPAPPNKRKKS